MRNEDAWDDDAFDYLIPVASETIRHYTGRRFTIDDPLVSSTREFIVYDDGSVYLDETFPSRTITVRDKDGIAMEVQTRPEIRQPQKGCWILFGRRIPEHKKPYPLPESHLDHFTRNMHGVASPNRSYMGEVIEVTSTWGYTSVPTEIDYQCARTVAHWFQTDIAEYATMWSEEARSFMVPEELPSVVKKALRYWKLPRSARTRA